jgi:hypothetical protein
MTAAVSARDPAMSVVSAEPGAVVPHTRYERPIAAAKHVPSAVTIVVHACDETSFMGVCEAAESRYYQADPRRAKIKGTAARYNPNIAKFQDRGCAAEQRSGRPGLTRSTRRD